MKNFACAALFICLAVALAGAQDRTGIHSQPTLPAREALERLHLTMAWSGVVPMDGRRDGLASVQLNGKLLLAQTRSGLVTAIDAETGRTLWRTRVGKAYQQTFPLAFNRKSVFAINGVSLFALDRDTGTQQWAYNLPAGPSAPPAADDYLIYIGTGTTKLYAFILPRPDQADVVDSAPAATAPAEERTGREPLYTRAFEAYDRSAKPGFGEGQGGQPLYTRAFEAYDRSLNPGFATGGRGVQPIPAYESVTRVRLEWAPVMSKAAILYVGPGGNVLSFEKFPLSPKVASELFRYQLTDEPILAPPGEFEGMAYVGSQDSNVYAINIESGRTAWRFTAGTPITRQPAATEKDVYVVAARLGMARVDRETGAALWRLPRGRLTFPANREADRFVAANPKFVYANDGSGRLLVLDRATGSRLGSYDGSLDFTFPVMNTSTDRIYLAANNGQLCCLHDRDYATPYRHSKLEEKAIDPRVLAVEAELAKAISDPGSEPTQFSALLKNLLEKGHNLKYKIAENAFREAGTVGVEGRLVTHPRVNNQPLGDVLRRILAQVDATYRVVEDTILIYPAARRAP